MWHLCFICKKICDLIKISMQFFMLIMISVLARFFSQMFVGSEQLWLGRFSHQNNILCVWILIRQNWMYVKIWLRNCPFCAYKSGVEGRLSSHRNSSLNWSLIAIQFPWKKALLITTGLVIIRVSDAFYISRADLSGKIFSYGYHFVFVWWNAVHLSPFLLISKAQIALWSTLC